MKKLLVGLLLLAAAVGAVTNLSPYQGAIKGGGFVVTAIDADIDSVEWELVNADTGFTQLTSPKAIYVEYAGGSLLDSIRAGTTAGSLIGVYTGSDTTDKSEAANPLFKHTSIVGGSVYGDSSWRTTSDTLMYNWANNDWKFADTLQVWMWVKSNTATNPDTMAVLWEMAGVNDKIRAFFEDTTGYLFTQLSDDAWSTMDTLKFNTDIYDAQWHLLSWNFTADSLRITVDDSTTIARVQTAATNAIDDTDSLTVFAQGNSTNHFRGYIDELYLEHGLTRLTTNIRNYAYFKQQSLANLVNDTLSVWIAGVETDDDRSTQKVALTVDSRDSTTSKLMIFEQAYLDTFPPSPILFSTTANGAAPRGAYLDSIPTGALHVPKAHLTFGKYESPVLQKVVYTNYAANAVSYHIRVYRGADTTLSYASAYSTICPAYVPSGGGAVEFDFGDEGLYLGPASAIAVFAKGDHPNASGAATLIGQRRSKR